MRKRKNVQEQMLILAMMYPVGCKIVVNTDCDDPTVTEVAVVAGYDGTATLIVDSIDSVMGWFVDVDEQIERKAINFFQQTQDPRYGKMDLFVALGNNDKILSTCGDLEELMLCWPNAKFMRVPMMSEDNIDFENMEAWG